MYHAMNAPGHGNNVVYDINTTENILLEGTNGTYW